MLYLIIIIYKKSLAIDDLLAEFAVERDLAGLGLAGLLVEALTLRIGRYVDVQRDGHFGMRRVLNSMKPNRI